MRRNTAGQVIGAQMITAADGTAFTGSVTVAVTGDGGTQATGSVGSGAATHEGNGFHTYAPAQAETDYAHVAFTFTGTGAIPVTIQVYPNFPQTGDSFARLGAPAGASVSADVAAVKEDTAATLVDTDTTIPGLIGTPAGASLAADIAAIAADQTPKRNVALSDIPIYLVSSSDHVTPATGVAPTVEISQDGGAFAAMNGSSAIAEVSDGLYQLDLAAADMNADVVVIKVTGTGADPALLSISTVD